MNDEDLAALWFGNVPFVTQEEYDAQVKAFVATSYDWVKIASVHPCYFTGVLVGVKRERHYIPHCPSMEEGDVIVHPDGSYSWKWKDETRVDKVVVSKLYTMEEGADDEDEKQESLIVFSETGENIVYQMPWTGKTDVATILTLACSAHGWNPFSMALFTEGGDMYEGGDVIWNYTESVYMRSIKGLDTGLFPRQKTKKQKVEWTAMVMPEGKGKEEEDDAPHPPPPPPPPQCIRVDLGAVTAKIPIRKLEDANVGYVMAFLAKNFDVGQDVVKCANLTKDLMLGETYSIGDLLLK